MGRKTKGQGKEINLLALIQGRDVPSSRYRVLQWLPAWRKAGHDVDVIEHHDALNNWEDTCHHADKADAVLFHRKRLSPSRVRQLTTSRRAIYDVDDAVMFRDALKPGRSVSWLRRLRYRRMVSQMDSILVGNNYIAQHTPNSRDRINVLPTCLDTTRYDEAPTAEASVPTLVWIGDTGSLHYLESRRELLEEIGRQVPGAQLKIICSHFFDLKYLKVVKVPWSIDTEVAELADSSVGLMPLGTDPWSQGKCALKFLQYLAVGRPAVVTPAGMNADILAEASCGLTAHSEREWVEACVSLLQNAERRYQLGQAGHRLVRERYSIQGRAADWIRLVSGNDVPSSSQ